MSLNRRQMLARGLLGICSAAIFSPLEAWCDDEQKAILYPKHHFESQVLNAGVGGNNTIDLLARVQKDCLDLQPTLTILMAGTNDMNSVKYVPIAQFEQNMQILISKIKSAKSEVLLMSILPAYEPYLLTRHPAEFYQPQGVAARRIAVNGVIEKLANKNGVHFLDLCKRFLAIGKIGTDSASLIQNELNSKKTDGIHPTPDGYRFIGLTVYDYISIQKLNTGKVVCFGDSITKGDGSMDKESYPAYLSKLMNQP